MEITFFKMTEWKHAAGTDVNISLIPEYEGQTGGYRFRNTFVFKIQPQRFCLPP